MTRIWEIDMVRGFAILLMVFFHALVDLRDFFGYDIAYYLPPWSIVGRLSAILFMLVAGISCSLSKSNVKRGLRVFLFGLVVTGVTYFFLPSLYIRFGILHFLGFAMLIFGAIEHSFDSDKQKLVLFLVASPLCIALGRFFSGIRVESPYLFFLGLVTKDFASYDHYPLVPWLGVFFAGAAMGILVYKGRRASIFRFDPDEAPKPIGLMHRGLGAIGKRSLAIYMLHQPILLGLLYLIL